MVQICQMGLLKLNFEIIPKKHIFRFLPKISAGGPWMKLKNLFCQFPNPCTLRMSGMVVIPQKSKCEKGVQSLHPNVQTYTANFWRKILLTLILAGRAGKKLLNV
jgi:hypothetical protein